MCGILALYSREGGASLDAIQRGLKVLRHRGPDSLGTWRSATGEVTLGHARLSIIDLSTGGQPLANEDASIHVVVNGEFYGFEVIRPELEARGHCFRTKTDSEILLHLYEEYGTDCLKYLRGEYAFVLWDERKKTLFAARDRFGIKPLFYSQTATGLSLASEVKALHATGTAAAWDEDGFLQTLALVGNIGGQTHFRNVKFIPPGHFMIYRNANLSIHRYWDFDFPEESAIPERPEQEHAECFRAVLEEAVRIRLRADVPVGCYLSGGVDSCSILALMARFASTPVRAFTLAFDHCDYDESPIAKGMAQHAGADFTVIPVSHATLTNDFSDAVWHAETLIANSHGVAKFALSRAVRDAGFKVVLTGEGADEILAGYPFFRVDLSRGLLPADSSVKLPPAFQQHIGYLPAWYEARESSLQKMNGILPATFRSNDLYERLLGDLNVAGQMAGRHVVNQSLYLHGKVALPSYTLTVLGDRMEMAHSIEGRVPFLDHHVVEFTRTLPFSQKIRGTTEKYVMREALRDVLTPIVYGRPKHPFIAPPVLCKPEEPLHQMMQDTLRGNGLEAIPFLNRRVVIEMLDRIPGMDDAATTALEAPLMSLFSASLMAERFGL